MKPINAIEEKIFKDKEFLTAIKVGKPRQHHPEGSIKKHIEHILRYIDKNYKNNKNYRTLRIIALMDDTGKLAIAHQIPKLFLKNDAKGKKLFLESKKFAKKYNIHLPKALHKIKYQKHCWYSHNFAKKFIHDKRILDIIKYHDLAVGFFVIYKETKKIDKKLFRKIFSKIDLELYKQFLSCDRCSRDNSVQKWFSKQLKINKI